MRRQIESHEWTIKIIKYVKEKNFDKSFNDFKDDNYNYNNDYDDNDNYDINNNSNFWRKASD